MQVTEVSAKAACDKQTTTVECRTLVPVLVHLQISLVSRQCMENLYPMATSWPDHYARRLRRYMEHLHSLGNSTYTAELISGGL